MSTRYETTRDDWVGKPERASRPAAFTTPKRATRKTDFVWRHLVLIVLLMFAFIVSMVYLAKHL